MERLRNPAKYVNQGMYIGRIEKLAVALLDEQSPNKRIRSLSEFIEKYFASSDENYTELTALDPVN